MIAVADDRGGVAGILRLDALLVPSDEVLGDIGHAARRIQIPFALPVEHARVGEFAEVRALLTASAVFFFVVAEAAPRVIGERERIAVGFHKMDGIATRGTVFTKSFCVLCAFLGFVKRGSR